MSLFAKIITDDKRFERMLSLELSDRGFDVMEDVGVHVRQISKKNFYTLVDLDFCHEDDIVGLSAYSNVIGFSYIYQDLNSEKLKACMAVLHRPFLMEELFSILLNDGEVTNTKSARHTRTASKQLRDKKGYLWIDHSSKKAVWDNEGIALSDNEYKVLSLLCDKRGEVVSRNDISELLGADEGNIADVYICMLRRKIDNRLGVKLIYTARGEGYILKN